jgi:hypothetical protein
VTVRGIVSLIVLFAVTGAQGAVAGRPGATVPSLLGGGTSSGQKPVGELPSLRSAVEQRPVKQRPEIHPAVVRVVAPGKGSVSFGSGTLVDAKGDYGLVITNYHVISESTGNISVIFPDGFYSLAKVRKVDRDWDLAALVIKRPNVQPVPLAAAAPRPGEPLTIAGYGSGNYRAVAGPCTQYVAPDYRMPFEMVELAASARQGDSGGPILNNRGELAGVLFGEGGGRTAGSYCGRVKWFLASLTDRPNPPPSISPPPSTPLAAPALIASSDPSRPPPVRFPRHESHPEPEAMERPTNLFASRAVDSPAPIADLAALQPGFLEKPTRPSLEPAVQQVSWAQIADETFDSHLKTFLAILGCVAAMMFALRILGVTA